MMEHIKLAKPKGLTSFTLRVVAMSAMLCDHIWVAIAPENYWLTYIGRIAFPIFSFLLVEGFFYTSNRWNYALRLFSFAALSELPFNLMHSGQISYAGYQNVLWTFLIGLAGMTVIEKIKTQIDNIVVTGITTILVASAGMYLANNLNTDYAGYGILTILLFYTCRNLRYEGMGEFLGLLYINFVLMAGKAISFTSFGESIVFPIQGFAVLSLFLIRKYNGLPGRHSKVEQYAFYLFYPLHMLILALLALNGIYLVF